MLKAQFEKRFCKLKTYAAINYGKLKMIQEMNTNHSIRSRGICLLDCYLQNVFVCVFVMREWYFCFLCSFWKCGGGWWCRWCVGM